uniref:Polyprotein protein n=1 Tax=Solanum tuberosum TaxID=4113 RepID=M1DA64_SOLTU
MSMVFGTVEIPDVPVMPPATSRDGSRVEKIVDSESEAETDEEMIEGVEEASYKGLDETKEPMIEAVVQVSLADTSLAGPSPAIVSSEATLGTDAQFQTDAPSTDGATP